MCHKCLHVSEFLDIERKVILDHIHKHKWCNKFESTEEAIADFVQKYAWLMREIYCGSMCHFKDECRVNEGFKYSVLKDISDGEIAEYIQMDCDDESDEIVKIKLRVLKHDIEAHKWLNKIDNYADAVRDFLNRFSWVISSVYQKTKESNEGK